VAVTMLRNSWTICLLGWLMNISAITTCSIAVVFCDRAFLKQVPETYLFVDNVLFLFPLLLNVNVIITTCILLLDFARKKLDTDWLTLLGDTGR